MALETRHNMIDYDDTYATFRWQHPDRFNFARDVIDTWAAEHPNKLAMHWVDDTGGEATRTFTHFSTASKKCCNVLTQTGVQRGDTVILILGRNIEWWEIVTACLRLGAVISPGTTQLTANDIAYRVNTAQATCFITDTVNAAKLEQVAEQCRGLKSRLVVGGARAGWTDYGAAMAEASEQVDTPDTHGDENAMCYFTSGTTGKPKMTMHTHISYPLGHETTGRFWLDLRPEDLHWNISDTGWAKAAWSSYFGPWLCGAAIFVHHTTGFDPKRTLELLQYYPITTMCGAPTVYRMLVREDLTRYRFPSLRHCVGAGEPLNPEIIEVWKQATGLTIRDGYGQTETVLLCGSFPCIEPRVGSMGKPAPGIDLQVIDAAGNVAPPHTEGDIAIRVQPERPVGLFKEYWQDPEKTAAAFKGDWYLTGDRAYVDEDGYFWFVGRVDDVILSSGYRIGPFEVESALLEHPAVVESAVVSSPDQTRGEVVKAFVLLAPGYEPSEALTKELQDHVKHVTAPYKYPRKLEFVRDLPKTVSGKIRRVELRQREWAGTRQA
ncbi:MAG: AMP-binding protein [Candidatus Tectomicrobia bacterium]|nr:AMP-binding protein [Candidatus Tectomicrobia bacterium]